MSMAEQPTDYIVQPMSAQNRSVEYLEYARFFYCRTLLGTISG